MRAVDVDGGVLDRHARNALGFRYGVDDSVRHFVDVYDGATPHTLVRRLAMADDRRHITAVRVKRANDATDGTGADIKAYELFWLHLEHSIALLVDHKQVRVSAPSSVIRTVCSKWADREPSAVMMVQPSSAV